MENQCRQDIQQQQQQQQHQRQLIVEKEHKTSAWSWDLKQIKDVMTITKKYHIYCWRLSYFLQNAQVEIGNE
jgi:hypothetical protein